MKVEIRGGSPIERTLMRNVIRGLEPRTLRSITILKSPPRWWSIRSAVDLRFRHRKIALGRLRPGWEEWMVAGAFGRSLVAHGHKGTITMIGNETGRVQPREFHTPDPPPASRRDAQLLAREFQDAAAHDGAHVVESTVARPSGLAPMLTLEVTDAARFLKYRLRSFLAFYDRNWSRYEGTYIGIVDRNWSFVLEAGSSTRMRAGSYWVAPSLDRCSPITHSEPIGAKPPPPCPA